MAVKHGGNLLATAEKYGSDPAKWIDLSTGVSPFTYPVNEIPPAAWNHLPQANDGLEQAAASYYKAPTEPVVVAGSQAAIMALPEVITQKLGRCGTVALPSVGYKEHQHAWGSYRKDGCCWQVEFYDGLPGKALVAKCDVVLVINPNNPTGKLSRKEELNDLCVDLAKREAILIVDEAFIDCTPHESMLSPGKEVGNLVVLRSVGKFFGLAGARVGFVFADQVITESISNVIGPWTVTGPSRWVVKQALSDQDWQNSARVLIHHNSLRLNSLLKEWLGARISGTDLFITVYLDDAILCHDFLCQEKVLTRLCDEKSALRFGLPADEKQWQHLAAALAKLSEHRKPTIELVLGGARSGKSSYAEKQAKASGKPVIYIATSEVRDEEMAQRVRKHQAQRPDEWLVIEEPLELAKALQEFSKPDNCILVDCLTLWLSNCLFGESKTGWEVYKANLLSTLEQLPGQVLFVSNEVGSGIVPMGEVSRKFVDEAGWLHQAIAARATKVTLVAAGLPLSLKDNTQGQ